MIKEKILYGLMLVIFLIMIVPAKTKAEECNSTSIIYDCGMKPSYTVSLPKDLYPSSDNPYSELKTATSFTKIEDKYFISDTYHNQIIYTDNAYKDISEWKIMAKDLNLPHGVAGDGKYYLVLDTDNNRVLVYEWISGGFRNTQGFDDVGIRPHHIYYDSVEQAFYVWSSMTGDMYIFVYDAIQDKICIKEIRHIYELENQYVRSFSVIGDKIVFPSGTNKNILIVDKNTFEVEERYAVSDSVSGMAYIYKADNYWYATVSTDDDGNQNQSKFIRTSDLNSLSIGQYENISDWFSGIGIPYYVSFIGGKYYMTNHGTNDYIYSFNIEDDKITDIARFKHK